MKQVYSRRLDALEAHYRPFSIPADLTTLTDAELEAIIAAGDPAVRVVVEGLTDDELERLVEMDVDDVDAYIGERTR